MARNMICPDCQKRGVTLRLRAEDHWGCRYCDFFCFTSSDMEVDKERRARLRLANPDRKNEIGDD